MTELRRLADDGETSPLARAVLRAATADGPSARARLAAQAALGIGVGVAVTATGAAATGATATVAGAGATAGKVTGLLTTLKLTVAAIGVGAVIVATPLAVRSYTNHSSPPVERSIVNQAATGASRLVEPPASAPPVVADTVPTIAIDALPTSAPASSGNVLVRGSDRAVPGSARLGEEVALLETARAKLAVHDARAALSALDRYQRSFVGGALAPEAAALRAIAEGQIADQKRENAP